MRFYSFIAAVTIAFAAVAQTAEIPSYINTTANRIQMNGADWSNLSRQFNELKTGRDTVVRVLHIGDSHIQAEFVTNKLRELLQKEYGNAGRGLMAPLRLAGTNQSHDYAVTSPSKDFAQTRLLKLPWPITPGVAGVTARAESPTTVTWRTLSPGHKIARATILHGDHTSTVVPNVPMDSIVTDVAAGECVYGAIVENGQPGVLYSAIGNNGATYNDYLLIPDFAEQTKVFAPALIVLSMGTNEAFSTWTDDVIRRSVRDLVAQLRAVHPDAAMLMLLPMECQKNRNHGYRPLSPDYDILDRNAEVVTILDQEAKDLKIPVWNFYEVAGGYGVSDKWIADKLMNKDRIHLLKAGYEVQATLLNEALRAALAY